MKAAALSLHPLSSSFCDVIPLLSPLLMTDLWHLHLCPRAFHFRWVRTHHSRHFTLCIFHPFQSSSSCAACPLICGVCCSYITEQGIPGFDEEQDAVLVDVYTNQNTSLVYVTFRRPLETSDDADLDRPWYLYYAYGPFDASSPLSPIGPPGPNLWVSTDRIRFDCERKSTL